MARVTYLFVVCRCTNTPRRWDEDKMAAATLCFEGTPSEVAQQQKDVYSIAKKYGGVYAGEEVM